MLYNISQPSRCRRWLMLPSFVRAVLIKLSCLYYGSWQSQRRCRSLLFKLVSRCHRWCGTLTRRGSLAASWSVTVATATIRVIDSYRLAIKLENKPGELLLNQNKQPSIHWLSQDRRGVHCSSWLSHRGRVTSQAGSEMSQSLSPGRLAARSRHSVTGGSHCVSSTHSF